MYKIDDFECEECQIIFEEFYEDISEVVCIECGTSEVTKTLSCANVGAFSAMSPERQRECLMNRSTRHTQKEINKEPERWGAEGKRRATKKTMTSG